jgi:halogenation protein CepH
MFVDPIFSAGVTLAVRGGIYAADTIVDAFQLGDFSAARLASYEARIRPPMDRIFELIRHGYDTLDRPDDMIRRSRDLPWLRERRSSCSQAATTRWTRVLRSRCTGFVRSR